jgi:thioredoxin-dependent peroxiredoxin
VPRLDPGTAAPDFALVDQDGAASTLADLRGRKAILFFYPEAMTPGCTTQACDFRDAIAPLQQAGYAVVGISRDEPEKLRRFREQEQLPYPLLSDPDRAVHEAYGVWGEKQLYGKTVTGVIRSTLVLDEQGVVTHTFYNTRATGHVGMLRKRLGV